MEWLSNITTEGREDGVLSIAPYPMRHLPPSRDEVLNAYDYINRTDMGCYVQWETDEDAVSIANGHRRSIARSELVQGMLAALRRLVREVNEWDGEISIGVVEDAQSEIAKAEAYT